MILNSDIGTRRPGKTARDGFWAVAATVAGRGPGGASECGLPLCVAHHPPFTAVARRQGDNPHMTALTPRLEKYRVSAGLFGHDHNYQHYLKNGIHYVTTAAAAARRSTMSTSHPRVLRKRWSVSRISLQ